MNNSGAGITLAREVHYSAESARHVRQEGDEHHRVSGAASAGVRGSARLGAARLGAAQHGTAKPSTARLGTARHSPA